MRFHLDDFRWLGFDVGDDRHRGCVRGSGPGHLQVNILVHSDSRGEETTCILTEVPDLEKPRQDLKEAMPSPSDTSSVTVITNIKAKPPKIVKVKSHAGKCDVSSSTARQKGAVG